MDSELCHYQVNRPRDIYDKALSPSSNPFGSRQYKTTVSIEYRIQKNNWKNDLLKDPVQAKSQILDYLVNPGFQGANRLFVLSF